MPNPFTGSSAATASALCAGRTVLATSMLAAPVATTRLIGLDTATGRRVSWLTRMMAARDGALGIGGLIAVRRGADPTPWVVGGAAADAVDALVIAGAMRTGRLRGVLPVLVAAGAAVVAALGAATAARI
jgi:hypothetical protein